MRILFISISIILLSSYTKAQDLSKPTADLVNLGQQVYLANCVACHGAKGDGQGPAARAINGAKPRDFISGVYKFGDKPHQVFETITKGSEGTAMPPWNHLSEKERWALSHYVLSLQKK